MMLGYILVEDNGYEELEKTYADRIVGIDASGGIEDIFDEMSQNISYIKLNCYLKEGRKS